MAESDRRCGRHTRERAVVETQGGRGQVAAQGGSLARRLPGVFMSPEDLPTQRQTTAVWVTRENKIVKTLNILV